MKYLFSFFIAVFCFYQIHAQNSGNDIFDNSILHEIRFEFSQTGFFDTLKHNYENTLLGNPVPYLMGNVIIDGETVDSVGVRFKGFTSYSYESDKKPIKIDFNEFVDGQKFDGLRKLNLNNGFGDPAMQRDAICYDLLRSMGVSAPRTAYARVYLNNEYWGVYLLVEQVDKEFLQDNFSNDEGNLFKNKGWSSLAWAGSNASDYSETFDLKTNKSENDWSGFINFVNVLNNTSDAQFKDSIQKVFNVDLYLRVLAVDAFTGNWDSYLDNARNWYMYEDRETGIFHWIPWDYNFALGGALSGTVPTDPIHNFNINTPYAEVGKILIVRLLGVEEFRNMYLTHFCKLLNMKFSVEKLNAFVDHNRALISEAFEAETKNLYTYAEFSGDIGDSDSGLKAVLTNHYNSKKSELEGLITCPAEVVVAYQDVVVNEIVASNDSTSNIADPSGEYDDWIELYNNTSEEKDLSGAYLSDNRNNLEKWQFPSGTTIAPNGYLIVWADKDEEQEGLHANFKLSKNGESVYFSNENGSLIDSISFGEQSTNVAFARNPNGTGNFVFQDATFNANNEGLTSVAEVKTREPIRVYPNPASSILTLDFKGNARNCNISVFSSHGQYLYSVKSNAMEKVSLDVSTLSTGFYILRIEDTRSNEYEVHKFIKE